MAKRKDSLLELFESKKIEKVHIDNVIGGQRFVPTQIIHDIQTGLNSDGNHDNHITHSWGADPVRSVSFSQDIN